MNIDAERCRELWGAVLNHGIAEALWENVKTASTSGSGVTALDQRKARSWIGSRGFNMVCSLAGREPELVESHIRPLFDDPEAAQAFLVRLSGHVTRKAGGVRVLPPRPGRGPKIPFGGTCGVPGCGRRLSASNTSGVCKGHNHAVGVCGCAKCLGEG